MVIYREGNSQSNNMGWEGVCGVRTHGELCHHSYSWSQGVYTAVWIERAGVMRKVKHWLVAVRRHQLTFGPYRLSLLRSKHPSLLLFLCVYSRVYLLGSLYYYLIWSAPVKFCY